MPTRTTRMEYELHHAPTTITVDAEGDEWSDVPGIKIGEGDQITQPQTTKKNWKGPDDLSAVVKVTWDDKNIYIHALVRDDHPLITTPGSPPHQGDSIELFIGFAGPSDKPSYTPMKDFQITFKAGGNGVEPSIHWSLDSAAERSQWDINVRKLHAHADFTGYELEARLSLAALGGAKLEPGQALGFDVAINDADDPDILRENKFDWACDTRDTGFKSPAVWNKAIVKAQ